jgi:3-oxoacyl-[acyl-carrier protein] reductase
MPAPDEMNSLKNKVAIVTGGASGIGRMTALTLARAGANVTIADVNLPGAKKVAAEIKALGAEALAVQTDVTSWDAITAMVAKTLKTWKRTDILVNDAAVSISQSILDIKIEDWDRVIAVNLRGPLLCCKAVVPQMIAQKGGVIVNVSSGSGFRPAGNALAYGCAKAGVAHLSRSLAVDLAKHNIRVNTVAPGLTDTPMTRKNWTTREALLNQAKTSFIANPMGVLLEPQDQANAIAFLCSEKARYITGQTLHVNAGSWVS